MVTVVGVVFVSLSEDIVIKVGPVEDLVMVVSEKVSVVVGG